MWPDIGAECRCGEVRVGTVCRIGLCGIGALSRGGVVRLVKASRKGPARNGKDCRIGQEGSVVGRLVAVVCAVLAWVVAPGCKVVGWSVAVVRNLHVKLQRLVTLRARALHGDDAGRLAFWFIKERGDQHADGERDESGGVVAGHFGSPPFAGRGGSGSQPTIAICFRPQAG